MGEEQENDAMQPAPRMRVKICCIGGAEEARLAIHYGASALGLVSAMPSGPGVIAEALIAELAAQIPPGVTSVLLTSRQDAEAIITQQRRCHVNALQICDRLDLGDYARLREALPGIGLIQVIHVGGTESLDEARLVAPLVDALLLDSGNQALAVKELGGTGRVHDWAIRRAIRAEVDVPIYLAGGITPANAAAAVRAVGPFALDVCTGVRTEGRLDEAKLAGLFAALDGAVA